MTSQARVHSAVSTKITLVIIAGALIMSTAMGIRQTFGLYIEPFSFDRGIPVTYIAFAVALHNLVWGVAQPFAGAAADRYGSAPVVGFGALLFAGGLSLAAVAPSGSVLVIGIGLLVGAGISCTSFGVVMTAVGRLASPEKRSMAMGVVSAGGSLGQVLVVPLAQWVTSSWGLSASLLVLALLILTAVPLGFFLDGRSRAAPTGSASAGLSLYAAMRGAGRHRGYRLLTIGFFACGFQLAFIGTHLPGYLSLCDMPIGLSATALAVIGLFNMLGSWTFGWLGGRYRQEQILGWMYLFRSLVIAAFVVAPKSPTSVLLFAAAMGFVWLGTVPLTSGLIAKLFGTGNLGTLFGICFLSHQIGSFLGAWLGGLAFDLTGTYTILWAGTVVTGVIAALLNFAIDPKPSDDLPMTMPSRA